MRRVKASSFGLGGAAAVGRGLAVALALAAAWEACAQNGRAARALGQFDLDRDDTADTQDSDADGLPDTWELGGLDVQGASDSSVPFARPSPVVPGTAATPLFSREQVRTGAGAFDTDGDGLSDFVEVFGLKFIDDNGNGILDDACARNADGSIQFEADGVTPRRLTCACLRAGTCFRLDNLGQIVQTLPNDCNGIDDNLGEWFDINGDGLPSIGEFPAVNKLCADCFDYDGFVFIDPGNPDTDGDGLLDGADNDPLVNPRAFGQNQQHFTRGNSTDFDEDNDGLGNGMDLGNDLIGRIDNPTDLIRVITLFRNDLRRGAGGTGVLPDNQVRVPEGLMEDLLGADWNGDGLFRVTDVRDPHFGVALVDATGDGVPDFPALQTTEVLQASVFSFDANGDGVVSSADFVATPFPDFSNTTYFDSGRRGQNGTHVPLPYQELLLNGAANNPFLPDLRIWTVLYAWRMPGFDIDGNGYIGYDSRSNTNPVLINGISGSSNRAASDLLISADSSSLALDGQIEAPGSCGAGACGALGLTSLLLTGATIPLTRPRRHRR